MSDDNPRRPHPGQRYRHGWIPVTAAAVREKHRLKDGGNRDLISQILAEAAETHRANQAKRAAIPASKAETATPTTRKQRGSEAKTASTGVDNAIRQAAGKAPKEAPKPPTAAENLQKIYGGKLRVHDATGEAHAEEFAKIPDAIHRALAAHIEKIDFGNGSVADYKPEVRGVQPRGWPPGKTWADVPGGYDPGTRHLMAGGGQAHGSTSLALHEGGHAVDMALGQPSLDVDFVLLHSAATKQDVSPYFAQAGAAGLSETWAEVFAAWVSTREEPSSTRSQKIGNAIGLSGDNAADIGARMADHFDKMLANLER